MGATLDEIEIKISQDSKGASKAINSLISSLEKLGKASELSNVSTNIDLLSISLGKLSTTAQSFDMGNIAKDLKKIPKAIDKFNEMPMENVQHFGELLQLISDMVEPLSKEMQKLETSFSGFIREARSVSDALAPIPQSADNATKSLKKMQEEADKGKNVFSNAFKGVAKFAMSGAIIGTLAKLFEKSVTEATGYIQTINNARNVMGEASKDAEELAEKLSNVLMLNPAQVMEFQTTFQNLFTGFGNTAKNSQIMSQNLTQLSYDMASFYEQLDRNPEAGMEKLRLAMAGTIEPLQRLGYALKEADLQAVAERQGLKVNVRNLNSASKSMLRYIAVMEQSERVQGNLARTFDSPATAMLVFKQAMSNLSTEIGKTFIPMLIAVVPYIQAFVKGALSMVQTINSMLGIELPTIEGWDKAKEGIGSVGEEADNTGEAIKKAFTMGIDELNVFDSSTSSAAEGIQDITGLLKLPKYDMTEGFNSEKLQEIEDKLKPLEGFFNGMAEAIAGFIQGIKDFSDTTLYPWLVNLGDWMEKHPGIMKALGEGLVKVAIGVLAIKAVGALANILGIPGLISNLVSLHDWIGKNNKLFTKLIGISLVIYGAFWLINNVINLITGTGDKWENIKGIIAATALVVAGLAIAFGAVTGAMAILVGVAALMFAWIVTHIEKVIGNIMILETALINFRTHVAFGVAELLYNIVTSVVKFLGNVAALLFGWLPAVGTQIRGKILNWFAKLIKGLWEKLDQTAFGKWLEEKMGIGDKIDIAIDFTEGVEDFGKNWEASAKNFSKTMDTTFKKGNEFFDTLHGAVDITTAQQMEYWLDFEEKAEQRKKGHDEEDGTSLLDKIENLINGTGTDDVINNITDKINDGIDKIDTDGISDKIADKINAGIEKTGLSEEASNKVAEMVDKQTEANDTQIASKQMQEQFNTDSLANDAKAQEALDIANKLMATDTTEVKQQLSGDTSAIITAIQRVEDACRDIQINVHYHVSGGGDGYATGGTPRRGEYFYAREDGLPEMVGRVGRQTTIMNNGQIADTMAESMVRAMSQSETTSEPTVIENKLYLDGEVVYTNQEKIKRSKGYSFGLGGFANV